MSNYKIVIEYDGTDFSGWQLQPDKRTVQGELERVLSLLNGNAPVRVHGAGRTDAGVHACGQVANFTLEKTWESEKLVDAINGNSEKDVMVHSCELVPDEFHARFSAVRRLYNYKCFLGRSPLERRFSWEISESIPVDSLNRCAKTLIGEIDFTSFCKHIPQQENRRCTVYQSEWINDGPFVIFKIEANRFLQHLVRCLVGTMVEVAIGRMTVEQFSNILQERNPEAKVYRAPAHGLRLKKVTYT